MTVVSVIVPFLNASATIGRCLESLEAQDMDPAAYEIIAVDDGSSDDSPEIARQFDRVRALTGGGAGSYAARNRGVAASRGPLLAFTDADCVARADWLGRMVRAMEDPEIRVVMGRDKPAGRSISLRLLAEYDHQKEILVLGGTDPEVYYAHTNNLITRRELLERIGGFEERPRGGDVIFVHRVLALHGTDAVRYEPDALVDHLEIDSARVYFRKAFIYGVSGRRYAGVVDAHPLASPERIEIFRRTVRASGASPLSATWLFGLLSIGVVCYQAGRLWAGFRPGRWARPGINTRSGVNARSADAGRHEP